MWILMYCTLQVGHCVAHGHFKTQEACANAGYERAISEMPKITIRSNDRPSLAIIGTNFIHLKGDSERSKHDYSEEDMAIDFNSPGSLMMGCAEEEEDPNS